MGHLLGSTVNKIMRLIAVRLFPDTTNVDKRYLSEAGGNTRE